MYEVDLQWNKSKCKRVIYANRFHKYQANFEELWRNNTCILLKQCHTATFLPTGCVSFRCCLITNLVPFDRPLISKSRVISSLNLTVTVNFCLTTGPVWCSAPRICWTATWKRDKQIGEVISPWNDPRLLFKKRQCS